MQVRVVEARDDAAALEVDDLCTRTAQGHGLGIGADRNETTVTDGNGTGARIITVNGMKLAIE
ncbi:hypothetical protein D3C80_1809100 [compost metagenome]